MSSFPQSLPLLLLLDSSPSANRSAHLRIALVMFSPPNPNPNPKSSRKDGFSSSQHHSHKSPRVPVPSLHRDDPFSPLKKSFLGPPRLRPHDDFPLPSRRFSTDSGSGSDPKPVEFRRDGKVDFATRSALGKRRSHHHHQANVEAHNDSTSREEYSNGNRASASSDRRKSTAGDLRVERDGFVLRIRNARSYDEEQRGTVRDPAEHKGTGFPKRPIYANGPEKLRDSSNGNRIPLKRASRTLTELNGGEDAPKSLASGASIGKHSESMAASPGEGYTSTRSLNASADSVEEDEKSRRRETWDHEFFFDSSRIMKKPRTNRHRTWHENKAERSIGEIHKFLEVTEEKNGSIEMQETRGTGKEDSGSNCIDSQCQIVEDEGLKSRVLHPNTEEALAELKRHFHEEPEEVMEDMAVTENENDRYKELDVSKQEESTEELVKQSRRCEVIKLEEGNPSTIMTQDTVEQRTRDASMNQEMVEEAADGVQNGRSMEAPSDDGFSNVEEKGESKEAEDAGDGQVKHVQEAEDAGDSQTKHVQGNLDSKPLIPIVSGKPENPKDRWLQDFLHERVLDKQGQPADKDDELEDLPVHPKEVAISLLNGDEGEKGEVAGSTKQKDLKAGDSSIQSAAGDINDTDRMDDHGKNGDIFQKHAEPKMGSFQLSLGLAPASVASQGSGPPFVVAASLEASRHLSQSLLPTDSDGFTNFSFCSSHSFMHNQSCSLNHGLEGQQLSSGCSREIAKSQERSSLQKIHHAPSISGSRFMQIDENFPVHQCTTQNLNTQGILSVVGRADNNDYAGSHYGQSFQVIPDEGREGCREKSGTNKASFENQNFRQVASREQFAPATILGPPAGRQDVQKKSHILESSNISNEKFGLHEIVSEPVAVMAQKMQELPESVLEGLKRLTKDLLGDFEKREEFFMLQKKLMRRTDLTERTLLHANMAQLEIFISLKTGLQDYVKEGNKPLTYKVLIEILLHKRCPNIDCKQMLPVNGCECRICSQKHGFCSECMCVVCYKFDSDNGSCQWVGCDACEHWCHADCALRKPYIVSGDAKSVGMQYRCVSCDRHCDLFGFVKGVFQNFSCNWNDDSLLKELDCVRRIFHGSEDTRGKQLYDVAGRMLQHLETNVNTSEVKKAMLKFFNEENLGVDPAKSVLMVSKHDDLHGAVQKLTPAWATNFNNKLPDMNTDPRAGKEVESAYLQTIDDLKSKRAQRIAEIASIQSMVRTKQEEAKMLQMQADEANGAASNLRRIISAKRDKIEQEFAQKCAQLRLSEAEDKRKKTLEELQVLEKAQHEYQKMKIMMEVQIKDLLMKLGVSKWQYAL